MSSKKLTYESAIQELQEIIEALEEGTTSIDELSEKAKRASELIAYCRTKLRKTEQDLDQLLGE